MSRQDDEAAYVAADIAGRTPRMSMSSMSDLSRDSTLHTRDQLPTSSAFDAPPLPTSTPPSPAAGSRPAAENPTSLRLRKRANMLRDLISSLDSLVLAHLAATYYFDTLSLLFLLRTLAHRAITISATAPVPHVPPALAPILSAAMSRQASSTSPQLALLLGTSLLAIMLHIFMAPPSAGEATRGYLHGGLFIDFVGQKAAGPILSRFRLIWLDIISCGLSVVMLCVLRECLRVEVAAKADGGAAAGATGFGLIDAFLAERARRMRRLERRGATSTSEGIELGDMGVRRHSTDAGADREDDDDDDNALRPMLEQVERRRDSEEEHPLDDLYSGQAIISNIHVMDTIRNCLLDLKEGRRLGSV